LETLPDYVGAMVLTEGRRLAFISTPVGNIPDFASAIIPPKARSVLMKRAPDEGQILVAVNEMNIFFLFGNYHLSSFLIEGKCPNYQKVIPHDHRHHFIV
jgi:DNA polymerase III sliding clamp (beta) subunit (PCNA family)